MCRCLPIPFPARHLNSFMGSSSLYIYARGFDGILVSAEVDCIALDDASQVEAKFSADDIDKVKVRSHCVDST